MRSRGGSLNLYRWENPLNHRYYMASIVMDLLDDWVVMRVWGGKSRANGRILYTPCSSYEQACDLLGSIRKTRLKRGYNHVK